MTGEPKRLTDPGSKSTASLRKLLEAGRSEQPGRARMLNLGARLGFGPGAAGGALKVASTAFTVGAGKIGVAWRRIVVANPTISSRVSPLFRKPLSKAAIWPSVALPPRICSIAASASPRDRPVPAAILSSACWIIDFCRRTRLARPAGSK